MRLLLTLLLLTGLSANAQPLWRNFFTTNQNPRVTVVAGSNATVQASTVGFDQRIFTVNAVPSAATPQTNVAVVAPGSAITVVTNGPAGGYTEFVISSTAITNGDTRDLEFGGGVTNNSPAGFVGNGMGLTNVPFAFWTNYTSNPLDFTNLNGLAFGSGMYGMTSYWGWAIAPGIGPIGIWYSGIDTNTVITTNGGHFSGAILDLSASATAPGSNQLVTASWVRNLFNVGASYYNSTNIDSSATNADMANQYVYKYQSDIPLSSVRTYTATDFLTNNGYVGAVVTTNTFPNLSGTIVVNSYLAYTAGGGASSVAIKPEIYISSDKTNWYNEVAASPQNIASGTTNLYQWLIDFPRTAATNAAGFYVQRRFKVVGTPGGSGTKTLYVFVGTNAVSGTADAAHLTMQSPTATAGNAYLANNQAFTGSNYFSQALNGTLPPPTNAPTAGARLVATSGSTTAWTTGFLTNANYVRPDFDVPYSELTTNAAFAFLAPTNVSSVRYQPSVVMVTNSTAAAVAVTAPANCHTTGTWYITNLTVFSFFNMAGRMTNCIAYPIW